MRQQIQRFQAWARNKLCPQAENNKNTGNQFNQFQVWEAIHGPKKDHAGPPLVTGKEQQAIDMTVLVDISAALSALAFNLSTKNPVVTRRPYHAVPNLAELFIAFASIVAATPAVKTPETAAGLLMGLARILNSVVLLSDESIQSPDHCDAEYAKSFIPDYVQMLASVLGSDNVRRSYIPIGGLVPPLVAISSVGRPVVADAIMRAATNLFDAVIAAPHESRVGLVEAYEAWILWSARRVGGHIRKPRRWGEQFTAICQ
ncbi:hypothetical protein OQA88_1253 [Cercophora sp. LCS_1]